jgi:F-type H+-transporting ATPase subunit c
MKMLQLSALVVFGLCVVVTPVLAQTPEKTEREKFQEGRYPPPTSPALSGTGVGAGLGMGLTIIGAGLGLGRIGSAALESMARQPEVAPRVQLAMLIIAAMLEGATLASVVFLFVIGLAKATF